MQAAPPPGVDELYDSAPCGLVLAAPDGRVLQANGTFCRWLGYSREDLCDGRRLGELFTTGGRIFFHTHLLPLLRMQGSVSEVKLEARAADGRLLPMILNIVERPADGATLLHIAAFIAEDRHKYERELLLQRRRAEELAEQHGRDQQELSAARGQAEDRAQFAEQLVGMVSHDIRNPLSVIHMTAVLLQHGVPAAQQKAVVARIARAVTRVQHLIGDLLDFTQARLGRGLRMNMAPTDLHRALADSVSELGLAFPGREIRHLQIGAGLCNADGDRLAQAVGNLVANAANHGAQGSPIEVRTETLEHTFRVTVHNHGKPIPAALLPRLFEPMVRATEGGAAPQGVGLGLYIVREIVKAHGGRVDVTSTEAEGTCFVIELPCGQPAPPG